MPPVFPWSSQSPLVAAVLVAALIVSLSTLTYVAHRVRRLLDGLAVPETTKLLRSQRFLTRAGRVVSWGSGLTASFLVLYATTWVYAPLAPVAYEPVRAHLTTLVLVAVALAAMSLGAEAIGHLDDWNDARAKRGGKAMNRQIIHSTQLVLRYALYLATGVIVVAGVLDLFGYQGDIGGAMLAWVTTQAGSIILVVSLVLIGWVGGRIIRAVANEVRWNTKRVSPRVVDAMGSVSRGVLYTVLGIVGLITILQSVGLGSVGGTLVVVLSTFVGLTVAMAGTGSIGNALSGIVLLTMRPLDKGDRVVVAEGVTGDVEEVSLMFTKVRTIAKEVVEIPNNQVLAKPIKNLSRSGPHAIVVKLGIGYDVGHQLVRDLATRTVLETEGFLKDPAPQVYARELGNYAIDYELYAFTNDPRHIGPRSALLGRLQENFYAAGVEIMTPDVMVMRPGKKAEEEGFVRVHVEPPLRSKAQPPEQKP